MEPQENHPNSPSSNCSTTTQTPPLTPRPITRSDPNPYPTTFVQADTSSFKQVVQMLTGSSQQADSSNGPNASKVSIPPVKKQSFKLYERRNSLNLKNGLMINPMGPRFGSSSSSPRVQELLSPSILDFPSLVLSPVTPLVEDPFDKKEEDRVIKEKGFYLHPSPRRATTPRGSMEPRLLPLFPVTSPRSSLS
uniref:VQ domain-containing protein n=1 Tax=Tanacetum cinerariifolium TaxID=118510 RepID=A0A6L2P3E5_TANCI|nr:hypothetical protein [Tanacetum cinerariifolium]